MHKGIKRFISMLEKTDKKKGNFLFEDRKYDDNGNVIEHVYCSIGAVGAELGFDTQEMKFWENIANELGIEEEIAQDFFETVTKLNDYDCSEMEFQCVAKELHKIYD